MSKHIYTILFPVVAFLLSSLVAGCIILCCPETKDYLEHTANPALYIQLIMSNMNVAYVLALLSALWIFVHNIFTGLLLVLAFQVCSAQAMFLFVHSIAS